MVFLSLGKHPNLHLDRLEDAVEEAETEIWVPELIFEELADHGPDGTTNPYLDHGIADEWIRVVSLPDSEGNSTNPESGPAVEAWREANHFLDQHSKYPTTNNWRDAAVVALAVHLFRQNKRIRVITQTADELLAKACAVIPPEFGYHEMHHDTTIRLRLRKRNFLLC